MDTAKPLTFPELITLKEVPTEPTAISKIWSTYRFNEGKEETLHNLIDMGLVELKKQGRATYVRRILPALELATRAEEYVEAAEKAANRPKPKAEAAYYHHRDYSWAQDALRVARDKLGTCIKLVRNLPEGALLGELRNDETQMRTCFEKDRALTDNLKRGLGNGDGYAEPRVQKEWLVYKEAWEACRRASPPSIRTFI